MTIASLGQSVGARYAGDVLYIREMRDVVSVLHRIIQSIFVTECDVYMTIYDPGSMKTRSNACIEMVSHMRIGGMKEGLWQSVAEIEAKFRGSHIFQFTPSFPLLLLYSSPFTSPSTTPPAPYYSLLA